MYSNGAPALCRRRLDGSNGTLEVSLGRDEVRITPVQ